MVRLKPTEEEFQHTGYSMGNRYFEEIRHLIILPQSTFEIFFY